MDQENNKTNIDNFKKKTNYFKLIIFWIFGTGIITNAIFIFGLGYYEGYLTGMGFNYDLFPIDTHNAFMWAYKASIHFATDTIQIIASNNDDKFLKILIYISLVIYIVTWFLLRSNISEKNSHMIKNYFFYTVIITLQKNIKDIFHKCILFLTILKPKKKILTFPINTKNYLFKKIYKKLIPLLQFFKLLFHFFISFFLFIVYYFFINQKSFKAATASYLFLVAYILVPIVALLWWFFPYLSLQYGKTTANEILTNLEKRKQLCHNKDNRWEECIIVDSNGTKFEGILIAKQENKLAIFTKNGPLTITEPTQYKFYTLATTTDVNITKTQNDSKKGDK